ncbi:MAG: hypothetical protein IPK68_03900 [Bdellovibrionales bacterium]|nr:hypothetical protein [Bdellovibrionales bacterium]
MDLEVSKKKISTFRGDGGRVKITDDSLSLEILSEWEKWTGAADGFYKSIGISANGMGSIIGRAKKLRREDFPIQDFKEIKVIGSESTSIGPCQGIEMVWENGRLIRFSEVDQLVDFLKKVE